MLEEKQTHGRLHAFGDRCEGLHQVFILGQCLGAFLAHFLLSLALPIVRLLRIEYPDLDLPQ